MKLKFSYPLVFSGLIALASLGACNQNTKTADSNADSTINKKMSIAPLAEADDFPTAKLTVKDVSTEMVGTDSAKMMINFDVANYELTKQTMDMNSGECANSDKGQHIHFIMDNKPYQALYKPENTVTLPLNSEHYLLCFLSRSYHLSVKSPNAAVLVHFKIDEKGNYVKLEESKAPMLFYSRPKGEYAGKDTQNLLLDFYVKNATLASDGYKVKVDVGDTTFTVDKWQPYFIKNAPMGELKLKIQLQDANGKDVSGDNTMVERTVTLKQ
ncbi:hypothetical protein I5M32_01055 [Pedobacter sp. SD-b]|uniref:Phosphopeptide-binding protein n=1 Tax=Pedobacter segetis TaxID=2793069 RepID=A0ABS1BH24_9SPHI|nr:hypothetical protein [Pedobacter segetis]MBK0381534.1 hypothetical protein [Pedobacter segetis]